MYKHRQEGRGEQVGGYQSELVADACYQFTRPLLRKLNQRLDRRLVHTFLSTLLAIVMHRHRHQGLLLSELGGYLGTPAQAPAGTKRLSRLLRSPRWHWREIERFLWDQGEQRLDELTARGEERLVVWDESVLEKSESLHLEGLGPVRSTKAARLKRIKPGYFNPPGGPPIFVPGWHWLSVILLGMKASPTVVAMRWWTSRGERARQRRSVERELLAAVSDRWGQEVIHVWDRGFAGTPWLQMAFVHAVRFVMRWPKRYRLCPEEGREACMAWTLTRGKRSWGHRPLWDTRRRCWRQTGVLAVPVLDPVYAQPLWLVVARPGRGREPWYLLTNESVRNEADAWRIVFIYARRWQVEQTLRFNKCELGFESPRLKAWDSRLKLLWLATLVYAFLLSLIQSRFLPLRQTLLRCWCHRTGKRHRDASIPLYRLRLALSILLLTHPPPFLRK